MAPLNRGDIIEVEIEKLIFGGSGLARYQGQVVFVDYSAPGDRIEIEIIEVKKKFVRAKLIKIIVPGKERVQPKCSFFGNCGGCQWQHISYNQQLISKQEILKGVIDRFFPNQIIKIDEFVSSPESFNYRNRIQLKVKNGEVGFYAKGSHKLVPIDSCQIANKSINLSLENLLKSSPRDGQYRIQINLNGQITVKNTEIEDEPLGFAQINDQQNLKLQQEIINIYKSSIGSPVIDLYGGYGNFSIPLAQNYPEIKIECIEWSHNATEEGIKLAKLKGIENLKFICCDVESYLKRVNFPIGSVVIIDPPRDGCSKAVIEELVKKGPNTIIYISCDPMTWGRDCELFLSLARLRGLEYCIAPIHGLDMFPQTDHIEVFSVLKKIN